jgi:hypothetical protein
MKARISAGQCIKLVLSPFQRTLTQDDDDATTTKQNLLTIEDDENGVENLKWIEKKK